MPKRVQLYIGRPNSVKPTSARTKNSTVSKFRWSLNPLSNFCWSLVKPHYRHQFVAEIGRGVGKEEEGRALHETPAFRGVVSTPIRQRPEALHPDPQQRPRQKGIFHPRNGNGAQLRPQPHFALLILQTQKMSLYCGVKRSLPHCNEYCTRVTEVQKSKRRSRWKSPRRVAQNIDAGPGKTV